MSHELEATFVMECQKYKVYEIIVMNWHSGRSSCDRI